MPHQDRSPAHHQNGHRPAAASRSGALQGEPPGPPVIASRVLLADRREIVIRHAGGDYRLRVTANNRLILTK